MGSTERKILLTVLRASGIPSRTFHRSSKLSVEVSAGERIWKTKECQGSDPEWNETLVLTIQDSAVLHVAVIDRVGSGRSSLRGETSVAIKDISDAAENTFQLQKEGSPRGEITLTFEHITLRESAPISSQDVGVDASAGQSSSSAGGPARRPQQEIPVAVVELVSRGANVDPSADLSPSSAGDRPAKSPEEANLAVDEAHRSVSGLTTRRVIGSVPGIMDDVNAIAGVTGCSGFALVFGYVEKLVNIGGVLTEVHPWAALAWSVVSVIPKTIGAQMDRDQKVQQLWSTMADMLSFLEDAKAVTEECQVPIVSEMMKQIYDCALFVREYCGKGFAKRALRDSLTTSTDSTIDQYNTAFKELKEQFKSRSELVALRIFKDIRQGIIELSTLSQDIKDLERTMLLENLPGTDLAGVRCDINRICLPSTRHGLLSEIMAWVANPSGKRAFWLHGVAGTGKSTVANTVTARFTKVGRLGASFRFNRDVDGRNGPAFLFGSIAYQLASFSNTLKDHILAAVKAHGKMTQFSPREQLQRYIIEPMSRITFSGPIVIVIDALDECGSERDRRDILGAIKDEMANFPPFVKLLLASRYEVDIRYHLERGCLSTSIDGVDGTLRDILDYIAAQMLEIADRHALPSDWLEPDMQAKLARHADGLFIWASVACDFIFRSDDPKVALHYMVSTEILHPTGQGGALDALYTGILRQASANLPSSVSTSNLRNIIGAIVTAKTPLTQQGLDMLLGLNDRILQRSILLPDGSQLEVTTCSSVIARLGSMLRKEDGYVRVLHASIFDFFTSPTRCTDSRFYIDKELFSRFLASRCFDAMRVLKRDICSINDPTKMNRDIKDLSQRLEDNVPEHVRYGCLYWHLHLADVTTEDRELFQAAKDWLSTHLLHWFEVMSLWGDAGSILIVFNRIIPWFEHHLQSDEVLLLLKDADRFVRQFFEPIRCNAAHIYASAIPFTPRHSSIFKLFAPALTQIPKMLTDLPESPSPLITLPVLGATCHPEISCDGSRFTCVHDYTTLRLWDLNTCNPTGEPLIGHQSSICDTCFSDDGTRVASVDQDGVIFVWDTVEYKAVGGPFGHHWKYPDAGNISLVDDHVVFMRGDVRRYVEVWNYLTGESVESYEVGDSSSLHGRYILNKGETVHCLILDALTGMDNTPPYARSIGLLDASFPARSQVRRVACQLLGGEIRVFNTETGALIGIPIPEHFHILMSPCGQWLATRDRGDIRPDSLRTTSVVDVYSASTGEQLMSRQTQVTWGLLFWSIGSLLFFDMSRSEATFDIWDMETMTHTGALQVPLRDVGFHRASRQRIIISAWDTTSVTVWDIAPLAKPMTQQTPYIKHFELSPTGEHALLTTSEGKVMALGAATWPCTSFMMEHAKHPVSFSPAGSLVATGSSSGDLLVWNPATNNLKQRLYGVGGTTVSIAISPNNTSLVAASDDGRMHLWDVASGRKLCTTQTVVAARYINALYLCADGRSVVYLSREAGIGMVDIMTSPSRTCDLPDNHWRWAELSRDATQITCVSESGNIGLLDGITGQVMNTSTSSLNGSVVEVAWSPVKDSFVTVHHMAIIQICGQYELSLACPMAQGLLGDNKITDLVFSSDGMWLAASSRRMVYLWDMRRQCLAWKKKWPFSMHDSPQLAFVNSESGCRVLVFSHLLGGGCTLKLFKADTGSLLLWIHPNYSDVETAERVVMSSNEAQAVFFDESIGGVAIELSTGMQTPFSSELPPIALQATPIWSRSRRTKNSPVIAYSSDGKTSASAHQDHTLAIFDMETGAHQLDLATIRDSSITVPAFSNDGQRVAWVIRGDTVQVWDKTTGTINELSSKDLGDIIYLAFSPLANHIVCIGERSAGIWGLVDGDLVMISSGGHSNARELKSAAFLGSHTKILLIGERDVQIWDTSASPSNRPNTVLAEPWLYSKSLLSPDGSQLLFNNRLYLVDTATSSTQIHKSFDLQRSDGAIFSSDSRYVVQRRYDHLENTPSVEITDVSDGSCMCLLTSEYYGVHTDSILFRSDCSRLVALFTHGDIRVWHLGELPHLTQRRLESTSSFPHNSLFPLSGQFHTSLHRFACKNDGWLIGEDGERLLWLPDEMRAVKLLTARRHGRLVLERASGEGSAPIVLDMSDYLTVPQVARGWREGGVHICDTDDEVEFLRAVAYM